MDAEALAASRLFDGLGTDPDLHDPSRRPAGHAGTAPDSSHESLKRILEETRHIV
jgi:hypothetical protein